MTLPSFKAYDIRGRVPDELDASLARRIGAGTATLLGPGPVIVGHDIRLSSPELMQAAIEGIKASGRDVIDIGLCGTEEVYFQTFHRKAAGGIMVTASHNPMDYNGMKLVREGAKPISGDTGLFDIRDFAASDAPLANGTGTVTEDADKSAYIQHLLGYIDVADLKPLKIVTNPGNGGAGLVIDQLAPHLPFEFIRIQHEADGSFPNGIPNPLLPENRAATRDAVRAHGADFGIAWDGDFDRCFFFDADGNFIEGYYLVGLLATALLARQPGGKVIHDPRLTWNTVEMVEQAGGVPIMSKTGHAFIKERMRAEDAIYGGEMSAHHYFREFAYCDSGMIPWLLIAQLVSSTGKSLGELVADRMQAFPCSGEINFRVDDAKATIARVLAHFQKDTPALDHTDGVSAEFPQWRFNLRSSNTEPLLRLNIETRGDATLLAQRTEELTALIGGSAPQH
ncbi:TPA: phosphomannomutase [Stenotrophomonas maltophilia]|uniref:phosphomannomutase n=1 Tax=Stenotrophomonas maltophilia TaxID=40324 RepID=UPI0014638912|nr:phosphomannomutase [Stenotrophomonas maltophilia]MBH1380482.1 phosphomannomutase [Stenotrophomonas maltophilia]MBH1396927.1 phosphomannomutase [Stenotrophomonas maltophilia]MBH1469765.1 phosphomannomutase [Stenotrophomonas maltophilia]MBH1473780.1 phosphomannomutase [Stenotrophomonas maltophilia]QJP18491.1 phosphomannomutase [Stenotrophomonas maltophilia]